MLSLGEAVNHGLLIPKVIGYPPVHRDKRNATIAFPLLCHSIRVFWNKYVNRCKTI